MWVDIDDVRAELERLATETKEGFAGRRNFKTLCHGMLVGYTKVAIMLDELEKVYRERESECVRGSREKGYEEQRKI